ncbi:sterol desaturase family protein [Oricola sp.]|uniref:sterol desaturase family protein n=1 Tax=Oricola sp. TaxID=1979950 RepID=UPI0025CD5594|nr:sterol desaturase family protein [Oricola sp.]MCI5078165.1 sterol desaturase family protein [Oricola sp.]
MQFSEATIRLLAFLAIFFAMALYELWSPRLEREEMRGAWKSRRWFTNLSIVILSSVALRIVFPAAAVGSAIWAEAQGLGLFRAIGLPGAVAGVLAFVILDFAVWLEHVASHKFPILWRFHRMHHADNGFDVTTALRFHPVEIVLSMVWKAAIVVALGAPVIAVLVFEIVLNGSAMFNHSNIALPQPVDRVLRRLIVTPDMHRVHHSSTPRETDSNYGFNFAFWDRLFGTYVAQPKLGHEGMQIGLKEFRGPVSAGLLWALRLPFTRL